jgi:hypothetical protein
MLKWFRYPLIVIAVTLFSTGLLVSVMSFFEKTPAAADETKILAKNVNVAARVGKRTINRLAGFASPFAEIQLFSTNLSRKTLADETGAFLFTNIPIVDNQGEFCLISQDINLLPSYPTCIAPPPADKDVDVIQVLLSPSLMVASPVIAAGDTVTASGMTFPDSPINVYLYSENETWYASFNLWSSNNQNSRYWQPLPMFIHPLVSTAYQLNYILREVIHYLNPVKSVYAFGLPKYETKSNANGHFEFSLPNPNSSYNRFFVSAALDVRKDKQPAKLADRDMAPDNNEAEQPGLSVEVTISPTTENRSDFPPKTNLSSQAINNQPDNSSEADLRVSPKSNTLYFRSLGWLGNLFNQLFFAFRYFIDQIISPLGLILFEMIIVLSLSIIIIYYRFRKDNQYNVKGG